MKIDTNEKLVMDMMQFSPFGALSQVFIIEAIRKYADACADQPPETFDSGMLNGEAWVGVAKDIKKRMQNFYDSTQPTH